MILRKKSNIQNVTIDHLKKNEDTKKAINFNDNNDDMLSIQNELDNFFIGRQQTVFIFKNLKEYTKKSHKKSEQKYYKLSKQKIIQHEFDETKPKEIIFDIKPFRFKNQLLKNNTFLRKILSEFINDMDITSNQNQISEENEA